jgi:Flp pilus assembly pilin Flp
VKFFPFLKAFTRDDSGALSVNWGVLNAAVVELGVVIMLSVGGGITGLGDQVVAEANPAAPGRDR